ncbi:class III lanthipeptide [Nonomuraea angiospora]
MSEVLALQELDVELAEDAPWSTVSLFNCNNTN